MRDGSSVRSPDDAEPSDAQRRNYVTQGLQKLVPQRLARRSLAVDVSTDRSTYELGEDVEITIEFRNRLPLPVRLAIEGKRIWGWTVDGKLSASDESRYASDGYRTFELRAFETRRLRRTWNCKIKRSGSPSQWVPAAPGEHEIGAFVATATEHVRDSTTVTLLR